MKTVWGIWCEWDIGLNTDVFMSPELAITAAKQALIYCEIEESFEELEGNGLIGFQPYDLHPEE